MANFLQYNPLNMASDITPAAVASALPLLFGLTGTSIGIYSLVSPYDAIRLYGLQKPSSSSSSRRSSSRKSSSSTESDAFQKSLVYSAGIRNIGTGLSTLGLYAFWKFSPICKVSPLAGAITKKCMGICFMFATFVGVGDAVVVRQFANKDFVQGSAADKATKSSISHGISAVLILATGLFLYL
ncbi:hypothetical protein FGRMN_3876 [Fusarium graminum]|nr:hypothetical protein FGRMN_3876 [Fusarium graminum]